MKMSKLVVQRSAIIILTILVVGSISCGDDNETESNLEKQGIDPGELRHELQQGWDLLQQGEYLQALYLSETILERYGPQPPTFFLRGRIYSELNRFDEAEVQYRHILDTDPDYQSVHFNLGNNYFRQTRFVSAITQYREELAKYPDPSVYLNLGRTYYKVDKVDSAKWAYEKALNLNEKFTAARYRLAEVLKDEGELSQAKFHCEIALDQNPANADYNLLMGQILYQQQEFDRAEQFLRRVLNVDPTNYAANYTLGLILQSRGSGNQAEQFFNSAATFQSLQDSIETLRNLTIEYPHGIENWVKLANKYQESGQYSRAIRAFNSALIIQPQNLSIHTNIGNLYFMKGDTAEALNRYQAVVEKDSTLIDALLNLGVVYANMGNYRQAESAWKSIIKQRPNHQVARTYLSRLDEMH